jgi:hypothetical protein
MAEAATKPKVIKRPPRNRGGITIDEVQRELKWREWFPPIQWHVEEPPAGDVEALVKAFCSFCEDNIVIKHPAHGKVPFKLRAAQREVITDWIANRKVVNLKARQIGFTTLVAIYCLWIVLGWDDKNVIVLSKGQRESNRLLAMSKLAYRQLPAWVKNRAPKRTNNSAETMTFSNDSMLQSLPSASEPARGDSASLIIVDEWAFLQNPDAAWASVEPVADLGGRVIGISTANGEGNFFHSLWLGAEDGSNGFIPVFFPWSAVEERDQAWYERKKKELRDRIWQLHQEYPSTAREAFVGSGNPVFDLARLAEMVTSRPERSVFMTCIKTGDRNIQIIEDPNGPMHIWKEPEQGHAYAIGADTAQGLEHGDYTVATVIDVETGEIVAFYRDHVDPDIFGEKILPAIGWHYNWAVVNPEVNNHGGSTLSGLKRANYGRIFRRRTQNKRKDRPMETLGFMTTMASKPRAIDDLARWMRDHNVPWVQATAEMRSFTRDGNGRMSGSPHDDIVMSMAMAVVCLDYCHANPQATQETEVPGSYKHFMRLAKEAQKKVTKVGNHPNRSRSRH